MIAMGVNFILAKCFCLGSAVMLLEYFVDSIMWLMIQHLCFFLHETDLSKVLFIFRFSWKKHLWFYDCCNSLHLLWLPTPYFYLFLYGFQFNQISSFFIADNCASTRLNL
jgi:hypothetical protein